MKFSYKNWITILLLGLSGQLAWMLENMYLNVYLFNELGGNSGHIAVMVALSAITATVTTIFMGAFSDRVGKRKPFIIGGYLLWGISVAVFSLIKKDSFNTTAFGIGGVTFAICAMIIWDCVMTFLGSTANDAAFNAWVTDVTTEKERGKIETVLAILPLIAMLVIFGGLDSFTKEGKWTFFFFSIGVFVLVGGILGSILLEDKSLIKSSSSLNETLIYGFKKATISSNKKLYISFLLLFVVSTSTQIWMPYLIIYIQRYLKIENYALVLGVVLIVSSAITVVSGKIIDAIGKVKWIPIGILILSLGLGLMYFAKGNIFLMVAGVTLMTGNMILIAVNNGLIRDFTPDSMAGRFQGLRMIFGVMIPMILGPAIGSIVISSSSESFMDMGTIIKIPGPSIFIAAFIVLMFEFIPYVLLRREGVN